MSASTRRKRQRDREHELDRMISAATYRAQRAREGKGYRFVAPPLREAKT
jgi:hypothetical protein